MGTANYSKSTEWNDQLLNIKASKLKICSWGLKKKHVNKGNAN